MSNPYDFSYLPAGINCKIFSLGTKICEDITLNFGYPGKFLLYQGQIFYCQKSRYLTKSNLKFER